MVLRSQAWRHNWLCILGAVMFLVLSPAFVKAADGLIARMEPEAATVGDSVTYVLEIRGPVTDVLLPTDYSSNVTPVGGSSTSSQISIINGRKSEMKSLSQEFRVVAPGPITFGPATGMLGSTPILGNTLDGVAREMPSLSFADVGTVYSARTRNARINAELEGKFFSVTSVPAQVYVGQAFPVNTMIYRQADFDPRIAKYVPTTLPSGDGVLAIDGTADQPRSAMWERTRLGDKMFSSLTAHRIFMAPTRPGKATITGPEMLVYFEVGGGLFADYVEAVLRPQVLEVEVLPLPAPTEDVVAQLVGAYTIGTSVDRVELPQGELLTLNIRISGGGFLQTVALNNLPDVAGFTKLKDESNFTINSLADNIITTKEFEVVYMAAEHGEYTIPPLKFAVFDPATGQQETRETKPITVNVTPASTGALSLSGPTVSVERGDARVFEGGDIQYIDTSAPAKWIGTVTRTPLYAQAWYWLLHLVPLALLGGLVSWQARQRRLNNDAGWVRKTRSLSRADAALKEAARLTATGAREDFYNALAQGVRNHVAALLGREASGLTTDETVHLLGERGLTGDLGSTLRSLLDRCDAARYSPAGAGESRTGDLDLARQLLGQLERSGR